MSDGTTDNSGSGAGLSTPPPMLCSAWVSCARRLPPNRESVIVTDGMLISTGRHYKGEWDCDCAAGWEWRWLLNDEHITHWMPLPALPNMKTEG